MKARYVDELVVGGGISGLYTAYRLKQKYPNKKVAVFEALPMLGGRIQTGSLLGGIFQPSYGAQVIEPDYQTQMHQFVQELGIPLQKLEGKDEPSSMKPNLDLLTEEERQYLSTHSDLNPDIALLDFGLRKILGTQWDLDHDHPTNSDRNKQLEKLKLEATFEDEPLYKQGTWNVFARVLSHEALEFCREKGAYYNMKNDNQNAADWIVLLLNKRIVNEAPYIPEGGMGELIQATTARLSDLGVKIYLNHRLIGLEPQGRDLVRLKFDVSPEEKSDTTWIAHHVILAIPQAPLKKLAASFPKNVSTLLESVIPIHVLWVIAGLKNPPWDPSISTSNGQGIPMRSAHFAHKMHEGNPYGMSMFWCDGPWYNYWRSFVVDAEGDFEGFQIRPQTNQNPRLKGEIEKSLQQTFHTEVQPSVEEWVIRDWGRPPFGAGVHFWKLGAQSYVIIQKLKAFSLNDNSPVKNIHICGEAFSERQGYCEGAIRSANYVIEVIDQSYQAQLTKAASSTLFKTPTGILMPPHRPRPTLHRVSADSYIALFPPQPGMSLPERRSNYLASPRFRFSAEKPSQQTQNKKSAQESRANQQLKLPTYK